MDGKTFGGKGRMKSGKGVRIREDGNFEIYEKINNLAEWMQSLDTRIETINERTKIHTIDIRKLEKKIKNERIK